MLALEPILILVTIYLSIVYGLLYGLFEAFPLIWGELRGFSPGLSGLIFVGVGIGTTIGALLNVWFSRRYKTLTPMWKGSPPPENRLVGAMVAGPVLVVGIFFLGWTGAYKSVPWYVPALATIVIGVSFTLVFISFLVRSSTSL
jgi:DHA1 family multidrug resistance protein-like MFS transporter